MIFIINIKFLWKQAKNYESEVSSMNKKPQALLVFIIIMALFTSACGKSDTVDASSSATKHSTEQKQ